MNDDERLLIEAAQRDPSRFADLYDGSFDRVYAYVVRRVRDRAEAEDVTSEVFHSALHNIRKFRWQGTPFVAWLYRIAANEIADRAKRAARQAPPIDDVAAEETDEIERRAIVYQMVEKLPKAQREVIVKRFGEDRTIAEIAQEMGRSEGAIKQLQVRALERLRRHYA